MSKSKRILYFGLDPSRYSSKGEIVHLPLIETRPLPYVCVKTNFSLPHPWVLFTSRVAITYYFQYGGDKQKFFICVGEATAERLADFGLKAIHMAKRPCAEGVIELLDELACGPILYPHSAKARPLLPDFLKGRGTAFPLYDTFPIEKELPDLEAFDRLVFTSPSTVEAFRLLAPTLPSLEKCEAIGPITQNALNKLFDSTILPR